MQNDQREAVARIQGYIDQAAMSNMGSVMVATSDLRALLSARPLALDLVSPRPLDLGRVDDDASALSTTPARAEAQDEGAAGEASAYRVRMISNDPVEWVLMHPEKALDFLSRKGWESQPLYAHPSPTPAADASCFECRSDLWGPVCLNCNPAIRAVVEGQPAADEDRVRIAVEAALPEVMSEDMERVWRGRLGRCRLFCGGPRLMGEKQGQPNNARLIEPNEHGVYQPAETLALPNPRPGWNGAPLAEIDLIELPDGWRSAIGAMLAGSGRGEPLTARPPAYATREEAIQGGIDKLRRAVEALEQIVDLGSDGEHSGDRHARCRDIARAALQQEG